MPADKKDSAGTFLYDLHPAVKFFTFICIIQMASVSAGAISFALFAAVFTALVIYSDINFSVIISKLKPFLMILAVTFGINLAFGGGLHLSAILTFRFLLIILFSLLLTLTTDPKVLISVILYPFKGAHGQNLRVVFMVAMEFIPVFVREAKNIAADIKEKPEYKGKAYKAVFKPEVYIKPMAEKLSDMSAGVAADVDAGNYETTALEKPKIWEFGFAVCIFALAVKYAL